MEPGNLLVMNIKDIPFLVELFENCTYDGTTFVSNGQTMFDEPIIMDKRGPNKDEIHVLMSWSPFNIRPIGQVVGHVKDDELIIYKKSV